jgi:hypothetical protein
MFYSRSSSISHFYRDDYPRILVFMLGGIVDI